MRPPSGHIFKAKRTRGEIWYAKYRLPDGRQVQRKLGPAWSERGRPPAGYYTKRAAGLRRGEIVASRRRDIDFAQSALRVRASYAGGKLTSPKSGKIRSTPWLPRSPLRLRAA